MTEASAEKTKDAPPQKKGGIAGLLDRADRFQQGRRWLAFPFAVLKKFGDDKAGNLAALIAYYGFFSLFPLLLVLFTLLSIFLGPDSALAKSIQDSALAQFPIIGDDIQKNIHTISGSGVALAIGIVGALWGGLGVTQAAQNAMNEIWDVPKKQRPTFVESRLRGLGMLALLGSMTLLSTVLAGLGTAGGEFFPLKLLGLVGSLALNFGVFLFSFRVLTDRDLSWRDVLPGAAVASILWGAAQVLGGYYVNNQVQGASDTYGFFGLVIGLLAWLYLGATLMLYSAEINVVLVNRLWPRSLSLEPPLTEGDERVLRRGAEVEERSEQDVHVRFEPGAAPSTGADTVASGQTLPSVHGHEAPAGPADAGGPWGGRSTAGRAASIAGGLQGLVRKETKLARQEIREAVLARVQGAVALLAGGVIVIVAFAFLAQAGARGLDGLMPLWVARLLVTVAFLAFVGCAVAFALPRLKRPPLVPQRTKRTMRENLRVLRGLRRRRSGTPSDIRG
ncbi:hypothetical protein BH20ACT24_BH20ACT24_11640 [soil metagenome]